MNRTILCLALALAACGDNNKLIDGAKCADDTECKLLDAQGTCESTGFCAYPDATCVGGSRYSPGATGMESECIGGDACGLAEDAVCCADNMCGANLACDVASRTCACSAADEPCCDGTTCDTGLTCTQGVCKAGIEQVAMGRQAVCVLRTDGRVLCWGDDTYNYGQSTPGNVHRVEPFAPTVVAIDQVVELGRSDGAACARKMDNTVWCWGHNDRGQLGNNSTASSAAPVQVPGLTASKISVGRMHTCAIGSIGGTAGIYCWGKNTRSSSADTGRLGAGSTSTMSTTPLAVDMTQMAATGQTVRQVVAGAYHTCAVMSDDAVWCWGNNENGQLGNNTTSSSSSPVQTDFSQITIPSGVTVAELALLARRRSDGSTAMRLSDGTVYVWGSGAYGRAGDGTTANRLRPTVAVTTTALGTATFKSIATTMGGLCGLDTTGKVWCWGDRRQGAIGDNTDDVLDHDDMLQPAQVVNLPATVQSLWGGHRAACVLDSAKHMWCWGNNRGGQLTRAQPTTVPETHLLQASDVTP